MEKFREMRRSRQELSREAAEAVLSNGICGVLAVTGDDDYPYAVPLNYVYTQGIIYIHCAQSGHKLDAIRRNPKVSFCVVEKADVVPEEYTSYYRSVIAFGKAAVVTDADEKRSAALLLGERYRPGHPEECRKEIDGSFGRLCLIRIDIEHLSGKQAKELIS